MKFRTLMSRGNYENDEPQDMTLNLTENHSLEGFAKGYSEQLDQSIDTVATLLAIATADEIPSNVLTTRVADTLILLNDLNISMKDIQRLAREWESR